MVGLSFITPETKPREWVSSLTFPVKPDRSQQVSPDSSDLNTAILHEYYKAPTLNEKSHKLSGAK